MNALIGSGMFCSDLKDSASKHRFFFDTWVKNVGDRDVVIVDNTEDESVMKIPPEHKRRVIDIRRNLGHVGSFLGNQNPKLGGWSMSWILPALMAYSESRDFIYQESDCLAFGDWEAQIYADAERLNLLMVFGDGSKWGSCEQSLFLIKREFILDAISIYLNLPSGDGIQLPENKFEQMEREHERIGRHTLPGGRNRPLPMSERTFYGQKFTPEELDQLRAMELI